MKSIRIHKEAYIMMNQPMQQPLPYLENHWTRPITSQTNMTCNYFFFLYITIPV